MKQSHKVSLELVEKLKEINFPFEGNKEDVSVMEMLDILPESIGWHTLNLTKDSVSYFYTYGEEITLLNIQKSYSLPNAAAEMVLWLHDNKYISFTK